MLDRSALKARARAQLGGGIFQSPWINALLVVLVAGLVMSVASFVAILVVGPISYGLAKIFLRVARGQGTFDVGAIFDGFKDDFAGTLLVGLMQGIFVFLWSLLFVIPGIIKSYAYSFAFYVKVDHPEYDWKQCLDESERLTAGHKGDLFILDLSFIGWLIVGSLACGVGSLWVAPYMEMTRTNYYLDLAYGAPQTAPEYTPAPEENPQF